MKKEYWKHLPFWGLRVFFFALFGPNTLKENWKHVPYWRWVYFSFAQFHFQMERVKMLISPHPSSETNWFHQCLFKLNQQHLLHQYHHLKIPLRRLELPLGPRPMERLFLVVWLTFLAVSGELRSLGLNPSGKKCFYYKKDWLFFPPFYFVLPFF